MALAELTPGTIFAKDFTVGELIAKGGMGAVYRAEQVSTGNDVALKIMLPEWLVDETSRARFQREARNSGRIKSRHVVKVIGSGIDDATETPWLAMEFLEGSSLADYAAKHGPLSPAEAWNLLELIGHALTAAHTAGVIHCDLKPDNVFIANSQSVGARPDVKVLDFGIARVVKEGRHSATVEKAVGSPQWIAPEQGNTSATVNATTDVWSFGLLAFWLLTGRYYWTRANVPAAEFNLLYLIAEVGAARIAPPSERLRDLGETQPLLPLGFDAWFARCVDRDVNKRFQSMSEAVALLTVALRTEEVPTPSAPPPPPAAPVPVAPPPIRASTETPPPAVAAPRPVPPPAPVVAPRLATPPPRDRTAPVLGLALPPGPSMAATQVMLTPPAARLAVPPQSSRRTLVAAATAAGVAVLVAVALPSRRAAVVRPNRAPIAPTPRPVAPPPIAEPSLAVRVAALNPWRALRAQSGLAMQQHEVTWEELQLVVPTLGAGRAGRMPAEGVSWEVARAFCDTVGGRLPTRPEWRAAVDERAVTQVRLERERVAVESDANDATRDGVHDLVGSVREWTAEEVTGQGHRVMGAASDDLNDERSDRTRAGDVAAGAEGTIGFRCVRSGQ